jgi:hypothetical protein
VHAVLTAEAQDQAYLRLARHTTIDTAMMARATAIKPTGN